ncbi:hypothetical protein [Oceanicella actignis]|uniref:Rod shape-determining protein MreD n=1 Tax=Oceanicella actignis TaxID=1189325 RepID=A0A1M7S8M4_9RHOB|nr:hypothetical protein [Oceanicella actignis]SET32351.1 hypothetical protein SAMN04488119_103468 [Oceanicella actignis]SHN54768.1 hypothetical protein SAMN05216200_10240 [Oceanicella actignis]
MNARGLELLHGGAALAAALFVALLLQLAPLGLQPASAPSPDLVWCVLAWFALNRRDALPAPALAAAALFADLALGGPAGAGALCMFLTAQALSARAAVADAAARPHEPWRDWAAASAGSAAVLLGQWLLMLVSFAGAPPLSDLSLRWAATTAAFPLAAAALRYGLMLRPRRSAS